MPVAGAVSAGGASLGDGGALDCANANPGTSRPIPVRKEILAKLAIAFTFSTRRHRLPGGVLVLVLRFAAFVGDPITLVEPSAQIDGLAATRTERPVSIARAFTLRGLFADGAGMRCHGTTLAHFVGVWSSRFTPCPCPCPCPCPLPLKKCLEARGSTARRTQRSRSRSRSRRRSRSRGERERGRGRGG